MQTHTTRLIFTIIFLILATVDAVRGYWFSAVFWTLIMIAVGYPFVQKGRLDLYYDDPVYLYRVTAVPVAAMGPIPGVAVAPGMPAGMQQLVAGTVQ